MARADDDDALRRRARPRARPPAPTSIASMYAQSAAEPRAARPSKMKMASLMADDGDAPSKPKRVKVAADDAWPRVSISSLTGDAPASLCQSEMPPVVQSFGDAANGDAKHGERAANGDASPPAARSMLDFFFPAGRAEPSGRSLKRKRRSARREELAPEVDLLRFGVDAAKLVPQGLVDRVDVHMTRAVLVKVVGNHVANWCNRAGFAPSFRQEITTLLAAYYPCNYPTLLDEVLAGFLFKRPEFMELLLPPMLEKMSKTGESVSTTKYPVADALVRMCGTVAVRTGPQAVARHDLACRSLLRCLVEHNGDRFVLSPWITACAIESSDSVLRTLWRALLPRTSATQSGITAEENDLNWRIQDPVQQIVELLAEEGKMRACRMTCGFVELLFTDDDMKKQIIDTQSYLIQDCLERAFKYASASWSASLLIAWLERRRRHHSEGTDSAGSFKDVVDFLVRFNSKLSVKKPDWFVKHVLSFVLSRQCQAEEQEMALRTILRDCEPLVFGGVDAQTVEQKARQNGSTDPANSITDGVATDLDVVGSKSALQVRSKIEQIVSLLVAANVCTSTLFLDLWSEAWSDKRAPLPWGYVHALLCVVIQDAIDERSEFGQKFRSFATRICRLYYYRLSRRIGKEDTADEVAIKFSEALNLLLLSTRPIAGGLLQEILGALGEFDEKHTAIASSIFGNTITLQLGSCGVGSGGVGASTRRSVVQKSLVEYDRASADAATNTTPLNSSISSVQILTTLKMLALSKSETGDFTRRVLSTGPVVRMLAGLLNFGRRRRRQETLLDVMNIVVTRNTLANLNRDWACQYVVQELVYCAYTSPPSSARKVMSLLQNIFRYSTDGVRVLLWVVLQQCTKLCCGHEENMHGKKPALPTDNYQGRADTFAELMKAMVITVPISTASEVLSFVEQKLSSCSVGKTRMNLFLLLLLRKLVVCELQCALLLPVVQLAVCPLASSDLDQIRLIQLQVLKALCTRLLAVRHRLERSKYAEIDSDWIRCKDLIFNERLQSDLRAMVKVSPISFDGVRSCRMERTSRASEVLAHSILAFTQQLKQQSPIDKEDGAQTILKKAE